MLTLLVSFSAKAPWEGNENLSTAQTPDQQSARSPSSVSAMRIRENISEIWNHKTETGGSTRFMTDLSARHFIKACFKPKILFKKYWELSWEKWLKKQQKKRSILILGSSIQNSLAYYRGCFDTSWQSGPQFPNPYMTVILFPLVHGRVVRMDIHKNWKSLKIQ